jgi:sugar lactone lactonase YvrE
MVKLFAAMSALSLLMSGCGGGGGGGESAPAGAGSATPPVATASFVVGGTVRGLAENGRVTLQNGSGASVVVSANGDFTFPAKLAAGTAYTITVANQPADQACTVGAASGTIAAADFLGVDIMCNAASVSVAQSGMLVSTLAGYTGSQGEGDGDLGQASFACPFGITLDSAKNLYVADAQGNSVRKITPAGSVSTLANQFDAPGGIARDTAGNLIVADTSANTINRITPSGTVSIIADVSLGASSPLPVGVALDATGNIYTVARGKNVVFKIGPDGTLTTVAGTVGVAGSADGAGAAARFTLPFGIAVDRDGSLYVSDAGNHTIRRITAAGQVTTVAGAAGVSGSIDGTGAAARFNQPAGLAIDASGNLYIVDNGNRTVRMMTPAGSVSTLAGTALRTGSADGFGALASFKDPYHVAVDASGSLYVTDCGNHTIRMLTPQVGTGLVTITPPATVFPETGTVTTLAGKFGDIASIDGQGSAARFSEVGTIAVDPAGNIVVADGGLLRKVSPSGAVTTFAGIRQQLSPDNDGVGRLAGFSVIPGMVFDAAGNLYIPGSNGSIWGIRKVTPAGVVTTTAVPTFGGVGVGKIASDGNGTIYGIAYDQIRKLTLAPVTLTVFAGTTSSYAPRYHFDGQGSGVRFQSPSGIATDTSGNVFVVDSSNLVIRKINPQGVVSTFAGKVGVSGTAPGYDSVNVDGTGSAARFFYPTSLAIDSANNLYVADNYTIRKITPERVVTTVAGLAGVQGSVDAGGTLARFSDIRSIAVDKAGTIYVSDNRTIRKIVQK